MHIFVLNDVKEVVLTFRNFLFFYFTGHSLELFWAGTHAFSVQQNHSPSILAGLAFPETEFTDVVFNGSFQILFLKVCVFHFHWNQLIYRSQLQERKTFNFRSFPMD